MDERQEDDYTLSPCGPLGSKIGVAQDGEFLGEFPTLDHAMAVIRRDMSEHQFVPNIWWISDHGNEWQIDHNGEEVVAG